MDNAENKTIQSVAKSVRSLFNGQKYDIEFYQREYKWSVKQVSELLDDLTSKFLADHGENDDRPRSAVANYAHYFLGSIVISLNNGKKFLIDGQQRFTTLTLLLIYLNNLYKDRANDEQIDQLIFSTQYGKRSFCLDIKEEPDRAIALQALYEQKEIDTSKMTESVRNIVERYRDIERLFPAEIKDATLPFFIDWVKDNIDIVEITAFSDEEAYTIFETMNDRGLSLTPTDMLKGYLLARINDEAKRMQALEKWKAVTAGLQIHGENETSDFFKTWLRSQYASSIRDRNKGALPEDFDLLGTQFHRWVRANESRLKLKSSDSFFNFITSDMDFFAKQYDFLRHASWSYQVDDHLENIYNIAQTGFTLQYIAMLAPLSPKDDESGILKKVRLVAAYLDILLARRLWAMRSISYSTLQYTIFQLVKEIRGLQPSDLCDVLLTKLNDPQSDSFAANPDFYLHKMNRYSVHHILARMTVALETGSKYPDHYLEYINRAGNPKNPFEVEHIWANFHSRHLDEFPQSSDFNYWRGKIGSLLLLPKKFNASYNASTYEDKISPYFHQNLLAASLNEQSYSNNPGFLQFISQTGLPFKAHPVFKKADQEFRQQLYIKLAEYTWRPDRLKEILS